MLRVVGRDVRLRMALWVAYATFGGEIPAAAVLADEMFRISGLEVEVAELSTCAEIRWSTAGGMALPADRVDVRRSRICNPRGADDGTEILVLTPRGDCGERTLVGVALVALESLGGRVEDAPHVNMMKVRARCGGRLTAEMLNARMRRHQMLSRLMMPFSAVAILFVVIYVMIGIPIWLVEYAFFLRRKARSRDA